MAFKPPREPVANVVFMSGRIDTHQHVVPKPYADWLASQGASDIPTPAWTTENAIAVMDAREIATGILSVSVPGVEGATGRARRVKAREVNELVAAVVQQRPDRFGFFATLTLPDVDGALNEAAYALDVLCADGVVLFANSDGRYLGDPQFDSLFAELDRRGTVVFVHPNHLPSPAIPGIPAFAADFLLDTTRAAFDLVRAGIMRRYRRLKIILSHAGGFVPYAAYRFTGPLVLTDYGASDILADFKRFYFDTALSASPSALPSLMAFADAQRVTFGSDWPFAPTSVVDEFIHGLESYSLDADVRSAIERRNAEALFPRLVAR